MNPLLGVALVRLVPGLVASLAALNVANTAQIAVQAAQANQANLLAKAVGGLCGFVGFTPWRMAMGAVKGALAPAVKLLPAKFVGTRLNDGVILQIVQVQGQQMQIITGPKFGSTMLYYTGVVVVSIIAYIVVKGATRMIIQHVTTFYFYKSQANDNDGSQTPKGPFKHYLN